MIQDRELFCADKEEYADLFDYTGTAIAAMGKQFIPNSYETSILVVCLMLICLSGCGYSNWIHNGFKVGPEYKGAPATQIAETWIDSDDERVIPIPPEFPEWWWVFEDPILSDLVQTAQQQNLSLVERGFRIQQARAIRSIATGNFFPQSQSITGRYAHQQISTLTQPKLTPAPIFSRSFNNWELSSNLSWELDFWGRFRRSIESADANLEATVEDYNAMLVCLIAEVVTAYIDIRTFQERLIYAQENVRTQEGSLRLTQERFDAGKTDRISVRLSKSNLETTRANIPTLKIGLRQANNRLCVLLGMPTQDLRKIINFEEGIPTPAPEVVVGIPADLLRRRPDVRAVERRLAAQSAQIGIALADLYPRIAITGNIFVSAENFGDLFKPLSHGGSIGPSFQWNLLNYGRIINNARAQDAQFLQLVAEYQNTVLKANQEAEDALIAFLENQERVKSLASSTSETKAALDLALIRFTEGDDDFTGVFILQGELALKQDQLAAARGDVVLSLAKIYKALGGGWDAQFTHQHVPSFQETELEIQGIDEQETNMEVVPDTGPFLEAVPTSAPMLEFVPISAPTVVPQQEVETSQVIDLSVVF